VSRMEHDVHFDRSWCREHSKWFYSSRAEARKVIKKHHPGAVMDTYKCSIHDGWHIGHRKKGS
jgi:hypothetical protein